MGGGKLLPESGICLVSLEDNPMQLFALPLLLLHNAYNVRSACWGTSCAKLDVLMVALP